MGNGPTTVIANQSPIQYVVILVGVGENLQQVLSQLAETAVNLSANPPTQETVVVDVEQALRDAGKSPGNETAE